MIAEEPASQQQVMMAPKEAAVAAQCMRAKRGLTRMRPPAHCGTTQSLNVHNKYHATGTFLDMHSYFGI